MEVLSGLQQGDSSMLHAEAVEVRQLIMCREVPKSRQPSINFI